MTTSSEKKEALTPTEIFRETIEKNRGKTLASLLALARMAAPSDALPTFREEFDWALYVAQCLAETIEA